MIRILAELYHARFDLMDLTIILCPKTEEAGCYGCGEKERGFDDYF